MTKSALIGKAGEMLVAAHLMRQGVYVAQPAYDGGIDLLAFREETPSIVVPIQVKARADSCYHFQKAWFTKVPGIVLVQAWDLRTTPSFFIFASIDDVRDALGDHAKSSSWLDQGSYNVTNPTLEHLKRMMPHKDRWDRITDRLGVSNYDTAVHYGVASAHV